jgi:uncharacterized membrane protein YhhN
LDTRRVNLPLKLFAVAAVAELVAVAADWTALQWVAKPLLAPLLIWHVIARRRLDLVVVALGFATAGDIALLIPGEPAFLVGMLFFLGAQLSFTVAFLRRARLTAPGRPTHPGSRRPYSGRDENAALSTGAESTVASSTGGVPRVALVGYGVVWLVANTLLWGQLGALRGPVLVYSLALTAMAVTAAGVSRRVAAGGALFLISDLLIGLGAAAIHAPGHDVLVMATYSAALVLIATGWTDSFRTVRRAAPAWS